MNISEINIKISQLESQISILKTEHTNCTRAVNRAFSFTDNWRDKQSFALRIPLLAKQLESLQKQLHLLKSEKEVLDKKIAYEKIVEAKKAQIKEEEQKYFIKSPIDLLEIE